MSEQRRFKRAIIVGGSVAGLATARALSGHFESVVIVERDSAPKGAEARKAVPQARHAHVLLEPALQALRRWFPGLIEELIRGGAVPIDASRDSAIFHYGGWKMRFCGDLEMVLCSRPFVEHHLRRRVAELPNVEIRYESVAEDLAMDERGARVIGARITGPSGSEVLHADLVVDAAGRGSRAPRWLEALGYGAPSEDRVTIDLAYTSRLYTPAEGHRRDWKFMAMYSRPPEGVRGGFLSDLEGGQYIISLNGYFGDHAPTDDEGFLAFARSLPKPELYEAIRGGTAVGPIAMHKVPHSYLRHYDRMERFPERLLVLGDSVCALNPIYGQGMTVSFLCARRLDEALEALAVRGSRRGLDDFVRGFQRTIGSLVKQPWLLSTTMDLRYPKAEGTRPLGIGALQWAFGNLIDMSSLNEGGTRVFLELLHMRKGPEALLHPSLLAPFVTYGIKSLWVPLEDRVNSGALPHRPA